MNTFVNYEDQLKNQFLPQKNQKDKKRLRRSSKASSRKILTTKQKKPGKNDKESISHQEDNKMDINNNDKLGSHTDIKVTVIE